jgi:hypothetical protein
MQIRLISVPSLMQLEKKPSCNRRKLHQYQVEESQLLWTGASTPPKWPPPSRIRIFCDAVGDTTTGDAATAAVYCR